MERRVESEKLSNVVINLIKFSLAMFPMISTLTAYMKHLVVFISLKYLFVFSVGKFRKKLILQLLKIVRTLTWLNFQIKINFNSLP